MEHARVDRRCQEVVGGSDCMDVTCQVQVHLLHRDDLQEAGISRCPSLAVSTARLLDYVNELLH